ncbi:MAG: TonB family protein [Sterolibacterium sp.]|nr:TonB family protein [Sterolibacterium sp.]
MDYAQQQRSLGKHLVGIAVVLILHVMVGYALVNGLTRKVVEVVKSPMETRIIEEANNPPPDYTPLLPLPKMAQLPTAFVPLPEVQIQALAAPHPAISSTTSVAAPVRQASPVTVPLSVGVACPNSQRIRTEIEYPPQARRDGLEGHVLIEFTVASDGSIKDVDIKSSTNRVFNHVSTDAVRQFKCNAQGRDVRVTVPFSFKLVD